MSATTPTSKCRAIAAIAQMTSTSDKFKNLLNIARCARLAKEKGASMLFLPECFGFMGESSGQTLQEAEESVMAATRTNDDSVTEALRMTVAGEGERDSTPKKAESAVVLLHGLKTIARESGLWISGGGMHVLGAPPHEETGKSRVFNTHVIIDETGNVRCFYRKAHLFDVSIPGKVTLCESATTAPGTELVVCDSPIGKSVVGKSAAEANVPFLLLPILQCSFFIQESSAYRHVTI
jgi:predicted amidohydrolase